jgi:hypothetical protein
MKILPNIHKRLPDYLVSYNRKQQSSLSVIAGKEETLLLSLNCHSMIKACNKLSLMEWQTRHCDYQPCHFSSSSIILAVCLACPQSTYHHSFVCRYMPQVPSSLHTSSKWISTSVGPCSVVCFLLIFFSFPLVVSSPPSISSLVTVSEHSACICHAISVGQLR